MDSFFKKEKPNWFGNEYEENIQDMCKKAFEAESGIIDWIFEDDMQNAKKEN